MLAAGKVFDQMDAWGQSRQPFVFMLDFDLRHGFISKPADAAAQGLWYAFGSRTNSKAPSAQGPKPVLQKFPCSLQEYIRSFGQVHAALLRGNSYLVNLTCASPIRLNCSLKEVYTHSLAPYKILYKDEFVVFSPEKFVQVQGGLIRSFPMKGTIDAALPDARQIILHDEKETAEHSTIVDLIRNDLSRVSSRVRVERFRYIDHLATAGKHLLQVSSAIAGQLDPAYARRPGALFKALLPAGSICGAPKPSTLAVIKAAETYERGFYTGVAGYFDGQNIDSAVMIRFIKKEGEQLYFCSGGGITVNSSCSKEYQEMTDKIYVPII